MDVSQNYYSSIVDYYLKQGGDLIDIVSVNKKFRQNKVINQHLKIKWFWKLNEFVDKENYNEIVDQCFKKDGNIKSIFVRGITNEVKNMLKLLYNCPFKDIKNRKIYDDVINEFIEWDPNVNNEETYMGFYWDWFSTNSKEERNNQFKHVFNKQRELRREEHIPEESKEIYYILFNLKVKTIDDYNNLKERLKKYKRKISAKLIQNQVKRKPENIDVYKSKYFNNSKTFQVELQKGFEETSETEVDENYINEWLDYEQQLALQEAELYEQFTNEDQEAARIEYINRPKPAEEDDGYDNAEEYFDDYDNYFDSDFNSIPSPDYSLGVVLNQDKNGNPVIIANFSGKDRIRKQRVDQVGQLFEDNFLKRNISNVVYRFHFSGVGWRTYILKNKEQMETMLESVKEYGATNVKDVSYSASSNYYEEHELPKIQFVDYLRIEVENFKIKDIKKRVNKNKGGEFFPYRLLPEYCYDKIDVTLESAQIFLSLCKVILKKVMKEKNFNIIVSVTH